MLPESARCHALPGASGIDGVDVIIMGRGGGSLEDLWAFNEEAVARAVAASRVPVISAVGHETDFTICDFVADLRAPTPSAAAELAVPEQKEEALLVESLLADRRMELDLRAGSRSLSNPMEGLNQKKNELSHLSQRLAGGAARSLGRAREELSHLSGKLDSLSPLKVLERGYAIAQTKQGTPVRSVLDLQEGEDFRLRFADGEAVCRPVSGGIQKEETDEP